MKYAWRALVAIGAMLVFGALTMETTVNRVYNLGLLQQQQLFLILGCVMLLCGIVLYAVKKLKQTKEEDEEEARRSKENAEVRVQALKEAATRAEVRAGTVLSRLKPGTDAWPARLLVGLLMGALWSFLLVWPVVGVAHDGVRTVAFLSGLVFSFWQLPAVTVLRRLMLTNAFLTCLSAAVVLELSAGEIGFLLGIYLTIVGVVVAASLVCPRRSKFEPPCRPNFEPGLEADVLMVGCA